MHSAPWPPGATQCAFPTDPQLQCGANHMPRVLQRRQTSRPSHPTRARSSVTGYYRPEYDAPRKCTRCTHRSPSPHAGWHAGYATRLGRAPITPVILEPVHSPTHTKGKGPALTFSNARTEIQTRDAECFEYDQRQFWAVLGTANMMMGSVMLEFEMTRIRFFTGQQGTEEGR